MNEKIKQLCEQAKVYATESTKNFTGDEPVVWMDYYTEKFAQLIVRECADFVSAGEFGDSGTAKQLIEHFGVDGSKCQVAMLNKQAEGLHEQWVKDTQQIVALKGAFKSLLLKECGK